MTGMLLLGVILPFAIPILIYLPLRHKTPLPAKRWLPSFVAGLSLAFSIALAIDVTHNATNNEPEFSKTVLFFVDIHVDALSAYFLLLVNTVAFFAALHIPSFLEADSERSSTRVLEPTQNWFHQIIRGLNQKLSTEPAFLLLFSLFHVSMLLVPLMDNLALLWLFIEITTIVSAPLVGYRQDVKAEEAAFKYIILSSTGILFAFLATIFLIGNVPPELAGLEGLNWSTLRDNLPPKSNIPFVEFIFLLALLGYGTKAGFFLLHTWLPDAHGQAPSPVSALLSGVLLKSALYAILRFYVITNLALGNRGAFTSSILLAVGLVSLVAAALFILKENRFKRVMAYHSLEYIGIITFAIGLGTSLSIYSALFLMLAHALIKALMFLGYGLVKRAYAQNGIHEAADITGVFQQMPAASLVLSLGGLALVGVPPFGVFLSKFMILWTAIHVAQAKPLYSVAIGLFLLSIALIFAGLVNHLGKLLLGKSPVVIQADKHRRRLFITLFILLVIIFWLGFSTWPITPLLTDSVKILCQGVCS